MSGTLAVMGIVDRLNRLDGLVGFRKTRPRPGACRKDYLARMAREGLPALGYAEALRSPASELMREVVALRAELDQVKAELSALRSG